MSTTPFVVTPEQRPPALDVMGAKITVLAPETAMVDQQITYQTGTEGVGPPPHSHDWDETFFVTKGDLLLTCDGQTTRCEAGTLIHVPARTVHSFDFGPDGGELLEVTGRGSGAIRMFTGLSKGTSPGAADAPRP